MTHRKYSQRQACALVRVARSSARYQSRIDPEEARLTEHIRELANRHQVYGCLRITASGGLPGEPQAGPSPLEAGRAAIASVQTQEATAGAQKGRGKTGRAPQTPMGPRFS